MDQARLRANFMPPARLPARASGWSASSGTAATRCSTGNLTVGDIVAANLYVLMMIWPLRMIGMLARAAPALGRRGGPHQRRARHRSRDRRRRRTPSRCPTGPGEVRFERRDVRLRAGPARARRPRPRDPGRPGDRARRRDRVGQVDRRPARSRASTTSTPATSASTAPTCARCGCATCGARSGLVFEDTFLFSDTVRVEHRVRRSGSVDGSSRARGASSRAPTTSCASCPTATTP